jgi:hypothetical protein
MTTTFIKLFGKVLAWTIILVLYSTANAQLESRAISESPLANSGTTLSVPRLVKFSAALVDGAGRPIAGTVSVVFSIYAQQQDEKPLWTETQIVPVEASGNFAVLLGASTTGGLPLDQFQANQAQWLGFHAEGQVEQARVLLVSTPYALKAAESESLNGLPASAFVQWKDLAGTLGSPQLFSSSSAKAGTATQTNTASASPSTTDVAGFIPKFVDTTTFVQSSLFDAGGKVGLNTQTPVAVLHITGDGTAELVQLETTSDVNTGLAILNSTQSWELALRQDLQEALVIRNKTTGTDVMQISPTGDLTLNAAGGGIVFPDGSRQTTASKAEIEVGSSPNTVVERDDTGSISVKDANLQGNLQVPIAGFISTPDAVDTNVGVIPKLFLSAAGGPLGGGVIPSLTFRSLNPSHIFGEVAFQDNTPSPGQDIWALQQDFLLNHIEDFAIRRRGQQVMTFWPLSANGSDVLTTLSGTRFRFERSGPYPVEFRDDSFALPEGLWRMFISQNCWFLDKNLSPSGNFANHNPVLETCADGNLLLGNGLRTSGPLTSIGNFVVNSGGNISLRSAVGHNLRFNPGTGGANLFSAPIGVGTQKPAANLHVTSGGNLQEAIFESTVISNEGISIRNPAQNWALGVRADRGEEFEIRNITSGIDALEVAPSGTVTVGNGNLKAAKGISVDTSVNGDGGGLKHGRVAVGLLSRGAIAAVELDWRTPFADTNYTVNCTVVNGATGVATLRLHHIQTVLANKVVAVIVNDDPANSQSGVLNCMAMHD